jgi:hypothetical protein
VLKKRFCIVFCLFLFLISSGGATGGNSFSSASSDTKKTIPKNEKANNPDSPRSIHVILSKANNFMDKVDGGYFSRGGGSGPGTGPFIGEGFEFARGSCSDLDPKWLNKRGWKYLTLGCHRMLLESDWCARLKSDRSKHYTLHFLSWTVGAAGARQRCIGDCENNQNRTAYIRTKLP